MAAGAKSDQVQIVMRALLTSPRFVVDLQVLHGTADLASPAIAGEHLFPKRPCPLPPCLEAIFYFGLSSGFRGKWPCSAFRAMEVQ